MSDDATNTIITLQPRDKVISTLGLAFQRRSPVYCTPQTKMVNGISIKTPVPRTRTGCLTCRKRKVKCDEAKPICGRCQRLQRECTWSDELQVIPHRRQQSHSSPTSTNMQSPVQINRLSGQNFVTEFPNIDRSTIPYIHHFVTFCTRFLCYSNDDESNPFQEQLFPLASSSPALLHSMAALAAEHLSRTQHHHQLTAAKYYSVALRELNASLSDSVIARSDSTLGACLLLCVYEIMHSESSLWLDHLQGARDLIIFRGGPNSDEYLTRFFSFLDISGSLFSGEGPLIQGDYWIRNDPTQINHPKRSNCWPYYDEGQIVTTHFHILMTYMARLARLSSESMSELGAKFPEEIRQKGAIIHKDLTSWWSTCPPTLRDQGTDWRREIRPQNLTVSETLEQEAFSSTKMCKQGCIIYLNHILDPFGQQPVNQEVKDAISEILEIARETPEGYGLEMGLYWGLFMAGIAIFNNVPAEDLIRQKLKADHNIGIYHANRGLELLEVLWKRQHQFGTKYDWRQVQIQMGIHIFILA